MIEVGSLDRVTAIIGERGVGKSTLTRIDAREFQAETGGYVIGHSPNGQIGAAPDIEFHDDLKRMARGLKHHPEKMHFVTKGPPEAVLDYGNALAESIKKKAFRRAFPFSIYRPHRPMPRGVLAPPVLAVIDEGTSMRRNPTQHELGELEKLLTSARHRHLALTWSTQAPTSRQWVLLEQANRLRIFRYVHEWGGNALRAAGIPQEVVPSLRILPKFVYYSRDKSSDSGGFRTLPPP